MCVGAVQLMGQNLRGEMSSDFAGTKLCLSDSRFIQVIAKSLSISCKEVRGQTPKKTKIKCLFALLRLGIRARFSFQASRVSQHTGTDNRLVVSAGAGSHPRHPDPAAGMRRRQDRRHRHVASTERNGGSPHSLRSGHGTSGILENQLQSAFSKLKKKLLGLFPPLCSVPTAFVFFIHYNMLPPIRFSNYSFTDFNTRLSLLLPVRFTAAEKRLLNVLPET